MVKFQKTSRKYFLSVCRFLKADTLSYDEKVFCQHLCRKLRLSYRHNDDWLPNDGGKNKVLRYCLIVYWEKFDKLYRYNS